MLATILRQPGIPLPSKAPDRCDFRSAMSLAVTGVNIVTTDGPHGRYGLTVSAVSSVSAEPPLLLVCVNQKSVACKAIEDNGSFAVNVLGASQQAVAETFSGSDTHGEAYAFKDRDWTTEATDSPVLKKAVATFDCNIESVLPAATHKIFIGRVLAARECPGTPLLYTGRNYGRPVRHTKWKPRAGLLAGTRNVLEQLCA
jgi:flavin reductase (DIM6/NTAB) family NADH-FMN oxidoreductase RutF